MGTKAKSRDFSQSHSSSTSNEYFDPLVDLRFQKRYALHLIHYHTNNGVIIREMDWRRGSCPMMICQDEFCLSTLIRPSLWHCRFLYWVSYSLENVDIPVVVYYNGYWSFNLPNIGVKSSVYWNQETQIFFYYFHFYSLWIWTLISGEGFSECSLPWMLAIGLGESCGPFSQRVSWVFFNLNWLFKNRKWTTHMLKTAQGEWQSLVMYLTFHMLYKPSKDQL